MLDGAAGCCGAGGGQALGEREAPDRRAVDLTGAEQVETVPAGGRHRLLVRHDGAAKGLEAEGADDPVCRPWLPGRVDVSHAVDVERRGGVGNEHPLGPPGGKQGRGGLVTVEAAGRVGGGELDVDRVVGAACREPAALLGVDDIVGRCDQVIERRGVGAVAQTAERLEAGHAPA